MRMSEKARKEAITDLEAVIDLLEREEPLSAFNKLQEAQRMVLEVLLIKVEREGKG